jgi:hypothetical protein
MELHHHDARCNEINIYYSTSLPCEWCRAEENIQQQQLQQQQLQQQQLQQQQLQQQQLQQQQLQQCQITKQRNSYTGEPLNSSNLSS